MEQVMTLLLGDYRRYITASSDISENYPTAKAFGRGTSAGQQTFDARGLIASFAGREAVQVRSVWNNNLLLLKRPFGMTGSYPTFASYF